MNRQKQALADVVYELLLKYQSADRPLGWVSYGEILKEIPKDLIPRGKRLGIAVMELKDRRIDGDSFKARPVLEKPWPTVVTERVVKYLSALFSLQQSGVLVATVDEIAAVASVKPSTALSAMQEMIILGYVEKVRSNRFSLIFATNQEIWIKKRWGDRDRHGTLTTLAAEFDQTYNVVNSNRLNALVRDSMVVEIDLMIAHTEASIVSQQNFLQRLTVRRAKLLALKVEGR